MVKKYALVINNQIEIYPLTPGDIIERGKAYEDYYEVFYNQRPTYNELTEYLEEVPVVIADYVLVNYVVKTKTIEQLLEEIFEIAGSIVDNKPLIDITLVPSALLKATIDLVKLKTQALLDDFARTRDYDDIKSACSYKDSNIEKFRLEAIRAIYLRDLTWESLNNYLNNVVTGFISPPTSWSEIIVNLPELTWDISAS